MAKVLRDVGCEVEIAIGVGGMIGVQFDSRTRREWGVLSKGERTCFTSRAESTIIRTMVVDVF